MSSTRSDYEMQRALAKVQQEQREKYEQEQRKQVAKEYTTELHRAVLRNDMSSLSALIQAKRYDLNSQDRYGNTALILAVMTRSYEAMTMLMDAEAAIKTRNKQGWNALAEAISQGDRGMIDAIWKRYKKKSTDELKQRTPELLKMFDMMGDFHLTITWKFSSWVPFVSRFLPSDTYHIYKSGRSIRCDTTLVDFDQMKWIRGDVSFVCSIVEAKEDSTKKTATTTATTTTTTTTTDSSQTSDAASTSTSTSVEPAKPRPTLNLMVWDNEAKTYTRIGDEDEKKDATNATTTDTDTSTKTKSEKDKEAEETIAAALEAEIHQEEIDGLMSNSISTITMPGQLQFTRAKAGLIPGWKKDKVQNIGKYEARVYNVTNINFQVTKRWEHMSPEEIAEAKQTSNLLNDSKSLQEKARAQVAASGATVEEIEEEEEEAEEEDEEHAARGQGEEEEETEKGEGEKEKKKEGQKKGKSEKGEGEGEEETSKSDKQRDGEKRLIPTSGTVATRPSAESDADAAAAAAQHHQHHPSLPPPPPHGITEEEYFDEKNGRDYIHLGRPRVETTDTKTYKATAWMCDNFPLSIETVVTILEIVAPHHRHMSKLKDFVQNRLPDGFPIKIEMPVFPTITATIEFGDFSAGTIDPKKFEIPAGYREETMEQREARQQDPDNPNRRATQDKSKKASQGGLLD